MSAEIPLAGQSVAYYRLVATNGSGSATATGWQGSGFGFGTFDGLIGKQGGGSLTQAGAHPYSFKTWIRYNTYNDAEFFGGVPEPVEDAKDITTTWSFPRPPGKSPGSTSVRRASSPIRSKSARLSLAPSFPSSSQIGVIHSILDLIDELGPFPLTTWSRRQVSPARFGATFAGTLQLFDSKRIPDGAVTTAVADTSDIAEGLALDGNALEFGSP